MCLFWRYMAKARRISHFSTHLTMWAVPRILISKSLKLNKLVQTSSKWQRAVNGRAGV